MKRFIQQRAAFTLAEVFSPHFNAQRKTAFTLAEVLITLGIIGVVAALTLPTLIQNHRNRVVETRLQKFYSAMNQAIKMAEVDYGDRRLWFEDNSNRALQKAWLEKYIVPYLKGAELSTIDIPGNPNIIYLPDGSAAMLAWVGGRDWYFFPGNVEKCVNKYNEDFREFTGKCAFAFFYNPVNNYTNFEPFGYGKLLENNPDEQGLKYGIYGCYKDDSTHLYCTGLIQYNNWKIPKDYPYKVSY